MSIFVNSVGLMCGKWNEDYSGVVTNETTIKSTFDDPIVEISGFNYMFDRGNNVTLSRWEEYYTGAERAGIYQIFVPSHHGDSLAVSDSSYIIILKDSKNDDDKEAVIFVMDTDGLNRKKLSERINWAMSTKVYGKYGKKNILHDRSMQNEYRLAIINDDGVSERHLTELLKEMNMETLLEENDTEVIIPDKVYSNKLGFVEGKWYEIRSIGSWRYYKVIKEIPLESKSTKHTLFTNDTMTVVTLYADGELSAQTLHPADLMKLDDGEYSPK